MCNARIIALCTSLLLLATTPPTLQGAHVGFYAVDLASGATLVDEDGDGDFIPASTMKLLVGSAALDLLPSDFSFLTDAAIVGNHLYLQGGGDPTLDDHALDDAAATIAALDIQRIDALSLDSTRYSLPWYPPGWLVDDLPFDYSAPVTALSLDENALLDAAVQDPMRAIATRFIAALQAHGIDASHATIDNVATPPGARVAWRRTSVGLANLLPQCWLPSDNLYGELFLNELGARTSGAGTTLARGVAVERAWLQSFGSDPATFTIADGSGLSSYDRATPRGLVAILTHDWQGPHKAAVLDALPIAGVRGTLEHHFTGTPLQGVLYAKTGSMNHTRTLAGYLLSPSRTIAFALLIDDWMDESPTADASLDAIRLEMIESLLAAKKTD